ncbi:VWA domain-containing protein [Actinomadura sp. NPDC048955]|uniref:VWA domain-containing protein n=1 Tax=Actinomadura sp. NPDC048955 TaxID=3158228 RepID=UPI0033F0E0D4
MPIMSKLTDLVAKAGHWLGLANTPPRHTRAVDADRFDQMAWRTLHDQAGAVRQLIDDLSRSHDYAEDLVADVWTAAYKTHPVLRGAALVDPSRMVNRAVLETLLSVPEFNDLRRHTTGDSHAAALAVLSQHERLTALLDQTEEAQEAAQQAARAHQAQRHAATAVDEALQAAAETTNTDGNVSALAAQAVDDAIAGARTAARVATQSAEQAADALAQAAPGIRAALRAVTKDAAHQADAEAEALATWGVDAGQLQRMDFETRAELARRLTGKRLSAFADMVGRFRAMASAERASKVKHAVGELVGTTLGDDVARLVPSELAALGVPALRADFAARLAEGRLMVYQTQGKERLGKGAIIACVDCSSSMKTADDDGITREVWAKACALALLHQARASRRDFVGILFSSEQQTETFAFPAAQPPAISDVVDFAEHFFGNGTDYATPLDVAADILTEQHQATGATNGDIVFITDGECAIPDKWKQAWGQRKHELGCRVFGIAVAHQPSPELHALSDHLCAVAELTTSGAVSEVFRQI